MQLVQRHAEHGQRGLFREGFKAAAPSRAFDVGYPAAARLVGFRHFLDHPIEIVPKR
jgi:hypothetical protein